MTTPLNLSFVMPLPRHTHTHARTYVASSSRVQPVKIRFDKFEFSGRLRIVIDELIPEAPYCKAVSVSFVDAPAVSYILHVSGNGLPNLTIESGTKPKGGFGLKLGAKVGGLIDDILCGVMTTLAWPNSCAVIDMRTVVDPINVEHICGLVANDKAKLRSLSVGAKVELNTLSNPNVAEHDSQTGVVKAVADEDDVYTVELDADTTKVVDVSKENLVKKTTDCQCLTQNERAAMERRPPQGILRIYASRSENIHLSHAALVMRTGRIKTPNNADIAKYAQQNKECVRKPTNRADGGIVDWNERIDLLVFDYTEEHLRLEVHDKDQFGDIYGWDSFPVDQWDPGTIYEKKREDLSLEMKKKGKTSVLTIASKISSNVRDLRFRGRKSVKDAFAGNRMNHDDVPVITFKVQFLPFAQILDQSYADIFGDLPLTKDYSDHDMVPVGTTKRHDPIVMDGRLLVGVYWLNLENFPAPKSPKDLSTDLITIKMKHRTSMHGVATEDAETFPYGQDYGVKDETSADRGRIWYCEHFGFTLGNKDDRCEVQITTSKSKHVYRCEIRVKDLYNETGSKGLTKEFVFKKVPDSKKKTGHGAPFPANDASNPGAEIKVLLSACLKFVDAHPEDQTSFHKPQTGSDIIYGDLPEQAAGHGKDASGKIVRPPKYAGSPVVTSGGVLAACFVSYFSGHVLGVMSIAGLFVSTGCAAFYAWIWHGMSELQNLQWDITNAALQELVRAEGGDESTGKTRSKRLIKIIKEMSSTKNLPEWATHPDVEKTDWLNEIVSIMWDQVVYGAEQQINDQVKPLLAGVSIPGLGPILDVGTLRLGGTPPIVKGVRSYSREQQGADQIIMDIGFMFANELKVEVLAKGVPIFVFQNMHLSFTIRIVLGPMVKNISLFEAVEIGFSDNPDINFDLSIGQFPIMSLPGLETGLNWLVAELISDIPGYRSLCTALVSGGGEPEAMEREALEAATAAAASTAVSDSSTGKATESSLTDSDDDFPSLPAEEIGKELEAGSVNELAGLKYPKMKYIQLLDLKATDSLWSASDFDAHGVLFVEVVEAHNLKNVDFLGKSDPFVMLCLNQEPPERRMTNTVQNELNPTWENQVFHFVVSSLGARLQFTVQDDDDAERFTKLGEASITAEDFSDFAADTLTEHTMQLYHKGKQHGSLKVNLEWKPFLEKKAVSKINKVIDKGEFGELRAIGIIFCRITRCSNLKAEPQDISISIENETDCVVRSESDKRRLTGTSPIVQQQLKVPIYSLDKTVEIEVDYGRGKVGKAQVKVEDISNTVDGHFACTCDLELEKGTVECSFDLRLLNPSKNAGKARADFKHKDVGLLRVYVEKATKLRNVEMFSKSDPLCEISLKSQQPPQIKATKHVDNDLNPEWKEYFEFVINNPEGDVIFNLLDHETVRANREIGKAIVRLTSLTPNVHMKVKVPISHKGVIQDSSFVYVQLEWKPFVSEREPLPPPAEPSVDPSWASHAWSREMLVVFVKKWAENRAARSKVQLQVALDDNVQPEKLELPAKAVYVEKSIQLLRPAFDEETELAFSTACGLAMPELNKLQALVSDPKEVVFHTMAVKSDSKHSDAIEFAVFKRLVDPTVTTVDEGAAEEVLLRNRSKLQGMTQVQQVQQRRASRIEAGSEAVSSGAATAAGGASPKRAGPPTATANTSAPTCPPLTECGLLEVTVDGAQNLPSRKRSGGCDAYVSMTCGRVKKKTTTVVGHNNPTWNNGNVKAFKVDNPQKTELIVNVKHKTGRFSMSKNESLGKYHLRLTDLGYAIVQSALM